MKQYQGGCHCGDVRYQVDLELDAKMQNVIACNCSICAKSGWLLTFTDAAHFKLLCDDDKLCDYQFDKKQIHHLFCKRCGVRSFSQGVTPDGQPSFAINIRCLDDVDCKEFPIQEFDGKSL